MNWTKLTIKPLIIHFLRFNHAEKAKSYSITTGWKPIIRSHLKTSCIKNMIRMEEVLMMNKTTMKIHLLSCDQNIEIIYLFLEDSRILDTQNGMTAMIRMPNSKALKFLQYHLVIHQIGQFNKINKASKKNIKYHITYFNQRNLYQQ